MAADYQKPCSDLFSPFNYFLRARIAVLFRSHLFLREHHQWCPIYWSHYYKNIRSHLCTMGARNVCGGWFLTVNQGNNQNFVPSLISKNHWRIFMGMKQNKNSKWPTQKNLSSHQLILLTQGPISEIFAKRFENWWFWKT